MAFPQQDAPPTPGLFFDTMNAYQRTEALKAALELDVFTGVAEGARTPPALAKRCGAAERGVRILCDYLVVIGFLTKDAAGYALTADSAAFLARSSPAYMGGAVQFLASPMLTAGFGQLAAAVRNGGTVLRDRGVMSTEHPVWVEFAQGMGAFMAFPAEMFAGRVLAGAQPPEKVLDIAAGHGLFGIAVARHSPKSQITALDWPDVLAVARQNAHAAGLEDRYRLLPGDALEVPFGSDYDLVLITNLLHGFDIPTCERLMHKVHAALRPGGRAVILEFVPDEDRVFPPIAATFSLMMLANTPGGEAYTAAELEGMCRKTGFSSALCQALPGTMQHVLIAGK